MTSLEKFGKFIITTLRDTSIEHYELLDHGAIKTPAVQPLQNALNALSSSDKKVVYRCIVRIIDSALHDVLSGLQEAHDLKEGIEILVDGENIAELSEMLHGEIFGEEGWIARFSKYPLSQDIPQ